jgi:hypothetical protein
MTWYPALIKNNFIDFLSNKYVMPIAVAIQKSPAMNPAKVPVKASLSGPKNNANTNDIIKDKINAPPKIFAILLFLNVSSSKLFSTIQAFANKTEYQKPPMMKADNAATNTAK